MIGTFGEAPAPAGQTGPYVKVRLWIDEKLHMLLQAEGMDANGRQVRILWVKSFKKINDRYGELTVKPAFVPATAKALMPGDCGKPEFAAAQLPPLSPV